MPTRLRDYPAEESPRPRLRDYPGPPLPPAPAAKKENEVPRSFVEQILAGMNPLRHPLLPSRMSPAAQPAMEKAATDIERGVRRAPGRFIETASLGLSKKMNRALAKRPGLIGEWAKEALSEQAEPTQGFGEAVLAGGAALAGYGLPITKGLQAAKVLTRPIVPLAKAGAKRLLGRKLGEAAAERVGYGLVKGVGGAGVGAGIALAEAKEEQAATQALLFGGIEMAMPHLGPAARLGFRALPDGFLKRHIAQLGYQSRRLGDYAKSEHANIVAAEDASTRGTILLGQLSKTIEPEARRYASGRGIAANAARDEVYGALADVFDSQIDALGRHLWDMIRLNRTRANQLRGLLADETSIPLRDYLRRLIGTLQKRATGRERKVLREILQPIGRSRKMPAGSKGILPEALATSAKRRQLARDAAFEAAEQTGIDRTVVEAAYDAVAAEANSLADVMANAGMMRPETRLFYRGAYLRRVFQGQPEESLGEQLMTRLEGLGDDGAGLMGTVPGKGAARRLMMKRVLTTPEQREALGLFPFRERLVRQLRLGIQTQGWAKQSERLAWQALSRDELGALPADAVGLYSKSPMPDVPQWGPLRGLHIPRLYEAHLKELFLRKKGLAAAVENFTTKWKGFKTAWSTGTHARNAFGDLLFEFLNDPVSLARLPRSTREVVSGMLRQALHDPDPTSAYETARRALALSGTWAQTEFHSRAAIQFAAGDPKLLERLLRWPRLVDDAATRSYGAWDTIAKQNSFFDEIEKGAPVGRAAEIAQMTGLDYSRVPVWAKQLARGWMPFVKFPVAVIQQTSMVAAKNPTRAYLLFKSPELYSRRQAAKDKVDLTTLWAVAPDWWNPRMMVYIGRDGEGVPLVATASSSLVWGDLIELGQAAMGRRTEAGGVAGVMKEMASRLVPGGPAAAAVLQMGVEGVRPLSTPALPIETQAGQRARGVIEGLLPPAVEIARRARTAAGPTIERPWARKREQEWWRLGGLVVYRADLGSLYERKMELLTNEVKRLERLAEGIGADFADLSPQQKQRAIGDAKEQLLKARREIRKLYALEKSGKIPAAIPLSTRGEIGTEK